jgi:lysophospholipase L1-like esterase
MTALKQAILILFLSFSTLGFQQQSRPVHVFMIGDSTMADKDPKTEPETGWGQALQAFFKDTVKVSNHAKNGRSSKSFMAEGLWKTVLDNIQPGDYVVIQFGHNDEKPDEARHADPFTTYTGNLKKYVDETRAKGASPILCTSIVRRKFDEQGILSDTHGDYPDAVRQLAQEMKVPLLDLERRTKKLVSELGPEKSKSIYLYASRGAYPNRPDGVQDDTHLNVEGATAVARIAVEEIRTLRLPLAEHLK